MDAVAFYSNRRRLRKLFENLTEVRNSLSRDLDLRDLAGPLDVLIEGCAQLLELLERRNPWKKQNR